MKKYIFTSDWHIRSNAPICRKDNFFDMQKKTLQFIVDLAIDENASIVIAGDIFDKARPEHSQELEVFLIDMFQNCNVFFIAGNHDLPYHQFDWFDRSSLGVLSRQQNWNILTHPDTKNLGLCGFSYGQKIINESPITIMHRYCEKEKLPFYIENGITAIDICERYHSKIFVIGDNHHRFVYENQKTGQKVFNTGCITRQTVSMIDYQPAVILYDVEAHTYNEIFLPDNDPNVIDIAHIIEKKERNERIEEFLAKLNEKKSLDIDFIQNLRIFLKTNKIPNKIKDKIWELTN